MHVHTAKSLSTPMKLPALPIKRRLIDAIHLIPNPVVFSVCGGWVDRRRIAQKSLSGAAKRVDMINSEPSEETSSLVEFQSAEATTDPLVQCK